MWDENKCEWVAMLYHTSIYLISRRQGDWEEMTKRRQQARRQGGGKATRRRRWGDWEDGVTTRRRWQQARQQKCCRSTWAVIILIISARVSLWPISIVGKILGGLVQRSMAGGRGLSQLAAAITPVLSGVKGHFGLEYFHCSTGQICFK